MDLIFFGHVRLAGLTYQILSSHFLSFAHSLELFADDKP